MTSRQAHLLEKPGRDRGRASRGDSCIPFDCRLLAQGNIARNTRRQKEMPKGYSKTVRRTPCGERSSPRTGIHRRNHHQNIASCTSSTVMFWISLPSNSLNTRRTALTDVRRSGKKLRGSIPQAPQEDALYRPVTGSPQRSVLSLDSLQRSHGPPTEWPPEEQHSLNHIRREGVTFL